MQCISLRYVLSSGWHYVNPRCVFDVDGHLLIDGSTIRDWYPRSQLWKKRAWDWVGRVLVFGFCVRHESYCEIPIPYVCTRICYDNLRWDTSWILNICICADLSCVQERTDLYCSATRKQWTGWRHCIAVSTSTHSTWSDYGSIAPKSFVIATIKIFGIVYAEDVREHPLQVQGGRVQLARRLPRSRVFARRSCSTSVFLFGNCLVKALLANESFSNTARIWWRLRRSLIIRVGSS